VISVVETSVLPATPERVWEFFRQLDTHYPDWHPEHLRWRTLSGEALGEGAVVFADEWLGPLRINGRMFIHDVEPLRFFAYRFAFPSSVVRAGGWFRFNPTPDGACEIVQEAHLGFSIPLLGRLVDGVLKALLPLGELPRHIREEQQNLIRLLGDNRRDGA
jgi:hypothetical protein